MPDEAQQEENNQHRGKAGVLASFRQAWAPWIWKESWVKARKRENSGNIDFSEQDDGCQWVPWISLINLSAVEYFHRNCRVQIAINNKLLLVGGEDLQKIIETVPEQPMNYKSQAQKLNNHVEAHRNITLEWYKLFNIKWPADLPQADFELNCREQRLLNCREQGLRCEFPVTIENTIIMLAVIKKGNRELQRELIWKTADLKSVCETARSVWRVKQGSEMMASGDSRRWAAEWKGG